MNASQPLTRELPRLAPAAVEALRRAAGEIPPGRSRLHAVDVVLGVLAQDGAGARIVDVLVPGRIEAVEESLRGVRSAVGGGEASYGEVDLPGGVTVVLDPTARAVFDALAGLAGRTADTKALLLAEAGRGDSVLVAALDDMGVGGPPDSLAPQMAALAKRVGADPSDGATRLVYRPIGTPPTDVPTSDRSRWTGPVTRGAGGDPYRGADAPYGDEPGAAIGSAGQAGPGTSIGQAGPGGSVGAHEEQATVGSDAGGSADRAATAPGRGPAPGAAPAGVGPVVDLMAQARVAQETDGTYVNPNWVKRALAAVERAPLAVVVTDSAEAADELARALAGQLARDTGSVFGYRSLVVLDAGYLATQPANALRDGLRAASGGLLYLPNIARYLDHSRSAGGSVDLRRALARGEVRVLGTVADRDLGRSWPPDDPPPHEVVFLEPAGIPETIGILRSRRAELLRRLSTPALKLELTDEAIEAAARTADRYYRDPPPPGGAIRLVQEAGTALKLRAAAGMEPLHDARVEPGPTIDPSDVLLALERLTGIKAQLDDQARLLAIEDFLRARVVGQDEAVAAVADAIRRARAGLKDANRPIGTFMFMGPSGVGKTELAKALAEFLFDDPGAMVRLDMSEYHERHTIARMIGAPPGYVGYDEGGQLTEPIRRKPYQLVLFDEIEKAHPDVHATLLQIMDDGRLTDSRGRTVDFRNTVVIMTGNVGSEYFRVIEEVGRDDVVEAVRERAREVFRPEFLGRIEEFIVFNTLRPEHMRAIVDIQTAALGRKLAAQQLSIVLSPALRERLATTGYAPELGARPLRNELRTLVERPLSRLIIDGTFVRGDSILADVGPDGAVVFGKTAPGGS